MYAGLPLSVITGPHHIAFNDMCVCVCYCTQSMYAGLPLSVETAPHYIAFNDKDIADGNSLLKCAPPIRDKANQEGLYQGLKVFFTCCLATCSPCTSAPLAFKKSLFVVAMASTHACLEI